MASDNQGLRHASALSIASATGLDYNGAFHALFTFASVAAGEFNGRMIDFVNGQLGTSHTEVNAAMHAFAVAKGAPDWDGLGTFTL